VGDSFQISITKQPGSNPVQSSLLSIMQVEILKDLGVTKSIGPGVEARVTVWDKDDSRGATHIIWVPKSIRHWHLLQFILKSIMRSPHV